jgi:hypothetical protein
MRGKAATVSGVILALALAPLAAASEKVDDVVLEAKLEQMIDLYRTKFPGNAPEKVVAFSEGAEVYRQLRKPEKAIPLYEEVLRIQKATEEKPSLERFTTLFDLADTTLKARPESHRSDPPQPRCPVLQDQEPGQGGAFVPEGAGHEEGDLRRLASPGGFDPAQPVGSLSRKGRGAEGQHHEAGGAANVRRTRSERS